MALKHPDGDFVSMNTMQHDFATQTIRTVYDRSIQDRIKEKDEDLKKTKKKENKFIKFIKTHKAISIIVALILLFTISLGGTYLALTGGKVADVQIPNVVGKTAEEAKKIIEDSKLVYQVKSEEYSETVEEGKVISQDPAFKEKYSVKEKSTIGVVISKGQKIVTVPKVTGKDEKEAKEELEKLGLKVEIEEEENKKVEAGYVIKQDVAANTEVNAGSTVILTVSKGIEYVVVPNLVGKTEEAAIAAIEEAGLTLNASVTEEDASKTNGVVIKQSIAVGDEVEKETKITITVNKIEEKKTGTVYVNVKSITGGYTETSGNETGNTTSSNVKKKVKLKVVAGGETIYNDDVDKNSTNVNTKFSGKGIVEVKVYIDDVLKDSADINLNTTPSYTFE